MKTVDVVQVQKVSYYFTADYLSSLNKNAKTKNIFICGIGQDEYNQISNFTTAKQIQDVLIDAHEGTSHVRKLRVAMLFTEYETFKYEGY